MAKAQTDRIRCPAGHPYDSANTYRSKGRRICRACSLARSIAYGKRRRIAAGCIPRPKTILEAFLAKVERRGPDECWPWLGKPRPKDGYGTFSWQNRARTAHHWALEISIGREIPSRLAVDHLCRNPICVNARHLEETTRGENVLRGIGFAAINKRKTHCPAGHEYVETNIYRSRSRVGWRQCRRCTLDRMKKARVACA